MKKIVKKLIVLLVASVIVLFNNIYFVCAFSPDSNIIYDGIDVSDWQGSINFQKVKNSGIDIVYIKATEGKNYVDPYFNINYENAKANNLKIGFYHFVRAENISEAITEAEHFANTISNKEVDCKLAMDFEEFGSLSNSQINDISKEFLIRLEEVTQKQVIIYSNTNSAKNVFSQTLADMYPLWVAHYGVSSPGDNGKWQYWTGWQYTSTGSIDGINGSVDKSKFTENILLDTSYEIPDNNVEENNNTIIYIVKRGDTLSEIALRFRTTISNLVRLNNIQNPNLIFIGQRLIISGSSVNVSNNTVNYIVRRGDTLSEIALKFGTTISNLVRLNNIQNPNLIFIGQRLIITGSSANVNNNTVSYIVRRGDTLSEIALRFRTTVSNLVRLNNIQNPNLIFVGQKLVI